MMYVVVFCIFFCIFKQKTAYEMRISDWSSDVCSSDLRLIDSDIIGIVIWDLDGTLIDANKAFLRMVQYEREDVEAGLRWFDMTPPEWQEVHAEEEEIGRASCRERVCKYV